MAEPPSLSSPSSGSSSSGAGATAPATPLGPWLKRVSGLGGRTLLVLCALILVVAAADRLAWQADWSADHRFTLSKSLSTILRAQHEPVEFIGMWSEDYALLDDNISEGLRLMAHDNPEQLSYRHIDPHLDRAQLDQFVQRYHEASDPAIYVVRSGNHARVAKIPLNLFTRQLLQREVGAALINLADEHPPRAMLLTGHGELRSGGGDDDGCDQLATQLSIAGFKVSPIELARGQRIPGDALLVLAGPRSAFGNDINAIEEHLRDGGATLIFGDDTLPADLQALLRKRGILWGNVLERERPNDWVTFLSTPDSTPLRVIGSLKHTFAGQMAYPAQQLVISSDLINNHADAIYQIALSGKSVLSPDSVSIQVLDPQGAPTKALAVELVQTYAKLETPPFTSQWLLSTAPNDSWLKLRTDFTQPHEFHDYRLAWSIESLPSKQGVRAEQGARVVVWGSRQAASDGALKLENFANADLICDMAKWAVRSEARIGIPPSDSLAFRIDISDNGLFYLMGGLGIILPCLFIGVAIIAWWERR